MTPSTGRACDEVTKLASNPDLFRRPAYYFDSARSAIAGFIRATGAKAGDTVLCPAYVGWSAREGSGVLDPLLSLGLEVEFYRVGEDLRPDAADVERRLVRTHAVGLVVIHYFGHVDPAYRDIVDLAHRHDAWALEDEAHALCTDVSGGTSGRYGDACVWSLHKMLPVPSGGALLLNRGGVLSSFDGTAVPPEMLWDFDLPKIAERRRRNAAVLDALLTPLAGYAVPLWPTLSEADVLQTYPVRLRNVNRDRVYELMNRAGFGVVSLYHTLVDRISPSEHPSSYSLSRDILNLPVHQDLEERDIARLVGHLPLIVDKVRREGSV